MGYIEVLVDFPVMSSSGPIRFLSLIAGMFHGKPWFFGSRLPVLSQFKPLVIESKLVSQHIPSSTIVFLFCIFT